MSWVRAGSILAALGVHAAALAALVSVGARDCALGKRGGQRRSERRGRRDDAKRGEHWARRDKCGAPGGVRGGELVPETKQQEAKREDAIEMDPPPPVESAPPQAPIQPKPDEKQEEKQEVQPTAPSVQAAAQQEQHAMSRELEARRNRLFSLYNAEIYRAIVTHAVRPKEVHKGQVGVELTLSPDGKLLTHRIVKSSGVHLLDQTAMANLESVPFPSPPDGLVKEPYTVTFSFDYSIK